MEKINSDEIDLDEIVSEEILQKWQNIVDILAKFSDVPVALIMRVKRPFIEVFRSSETEKNPYKVGNKEHLTGLYCERVINTDKKLLVKNALKSEEWKDNPDIALGMISYLGFPIELPNKQIFGTICILDTKERKYNKDIENLMLQFKELIELHINLTYKNFKLEQLINREEFFRDLISHDINNILQNVKTSTELLKEKISKTQNIKVGEILEILDTQVYHGKKLIDNTKAFSSLEKEGAPLERVDLCKYLTEAIKEVLETFKSRNIDIKVFSEENEFYILGNEYLRDMFENLLLRSIKNGKNDKIEINIELKVIERKNSKYLKTKITDNTKGHSEEEVIFQKGTYTGKKEKGTEIGLELVHRIIDLFNGDISVKNKIENKPSQGSIFTILFPLA